MATRLEEVIRNMITESEEIMHEIVDNVVEEPIDIISTLPPYNSTSTRPIDFSAYVAAVDTLSSSMGGVKDVVQQEIDSIIQNFKEVYAKAVREPSNLLSNAISRNAMADAAASGDFSSIGKQFRTELSYQVGQSFDEWFTANKGKEETIFQQGFADKRNFVFVKNMYRALVDMSTEQNEKLDLVDELEEAVVDLENEKKYLQEFRNKLDFTSKYATKTQTHDLLIELLTTDTRINPIKKRIDRLLKEQTQSVAKKNDLKAHEDIAVSQKQVYQPKKYKKAQVNYFIEHGAKPSEAKRYIDKYGFEHAFSVLEALDDFFTEVGFGILPVKRILKKHPDILYMDNGELDEYVSALEELYSRFSKDNIPSGIRPRENNKYGSAKDILSLVPKKFSVNVHGVELVTVRDHQKKALSMLGSLPLATTRHLEHASGPYNAAIAEFGKPQTNYRVSDFNLPCAGRLLVDYQKNNDSVDVFIKKHFPTHTDYEYWYAGFRKD